MTWPTGSGPGAPASSPAPATTSPGWTGRRAGCPRWTPGSPSAGSGARRLPRRARPDPPRRRRGTRPGRPPAAALRDRPGDLGVRASCGSGRCPRFWTDQALGPVFDALLRPGVDEARIAEVSPAAARRPRHPGARPGGAGRRGPRVRRAGARGTRRHRRPARRVRRRARRDLSRGAGGPEVGRRARPARPGRATPAGWPRRCPACRQPSRSVREQYQWFLREVACVPLAIGEIDAIGRREYDRAVWLELVHRTAEQGRPRAAAAGRRRRAVPREDAAEAAVREFYDEQRPAQPAAVLRPLPGAADARLPGAAALPRRRRRADRPGRLTENGVAYVPEPGPACPTSTPPTPATRARGSSTRASTTSSSPCPGATRGRCGGTTTTPVPTRASRSTTRS